MARDSEGFRFTAAVERPLSVVFRREDGAWEGHDYRVEVVSARDGLDASDVVMDFRDLEAHLDQVLAPLQGRLLSDLGLAGPEALATHLGSALGPCVPAPARLEELSLTDGTARRLTWRP
ncbi:MAG: 6-carboxytetrahydropterin synthase [Acidobacteria bacterium]|nr:6-carboxytetrahydropterin synthase [Acidobacteriota bacterium]